MRYYDICKYVSMNNNKEKKQWKNVSNLIGVQN